MQECIKSGTHLYFILCTSKCYFVNVYGLTMAGMQHDAH